MKKFQYVLKDPLGLHARPAGLLVREAQKYQSEITLTLLSGGKSASAKKLLAVMGLGVKGGDAVEVSVSGADEVSAGEELLRWMEKNI